MAVINGKNKITGIILAVLVLFFMTIINVNSETKAKVQPGASMAIGEAKDNFSYGGSVDVYLDHYFFPSFYTGVKIGFDVLPINLVTDNLFILSAGLNTGFSFRLLPFMSASLFGGGGYYYGLIDPQTAGTDYYLSAGVGASFKILPSLTLGTGAVYKNYLSTSPNSAGYSLYQGIGVYLSGSFQIGEGAAPEVRFKEIYTDPIFPILFTHYENNPFGSVTLENNSVNSIKNIKLSVYIPQYMDKPRICAENLNLASGKSIPVPLSALFNDKILTVTEGAKVSMELTMDFTYGGKSRTEKRVETVEILYRNAMTWDDDRKAASFVTAKDPDVLRFAKNVTSTVRNISNNAINKNFRTALGLFESLGKYGVEYVIDPNSSYRELSKNAMALDYLQFPAQTLTYKAGDCDDLSILYTALLESVGIKTAFITIPGHIYMAFSLGLSEKDAAKLFTNRDNLIFMNNTAWIPVEITLVQDGFVKAWRVGAKEWRDNFSKNKAKFYPMNEAWAVYSPVESPSEKTDINLPDMASLGAMYVAEMERFATGEIQQKVEYLKSKIKTASNPEKYRNSLGVLYARYGFLNKAIKELKVGSNNSYTPAMVNLANVYFIQGKYKDALGYYKMASRRSPGSLAVLVGLARTNYQLGKQAEVNKSFMKIEKKDPDIADRYAFLVSGGDSTARASEAADKEVLTWEE